MAATRNAKNPTSGNDTPNTPEVSESAIAAMKVGELRRSLQGRGVKGTADLKKPELVKRLIELETSGTKAARSAGKKSTSAAKGASAKKSTSAVKGGSAKKSGAGRNNPTSGNDTPNTPEVSESAIAAMKVGELRRSLQGRGVKGTADLKKPELVKRLIELETSGTKPARSAGKK
ncbi:hypothetical protein AB0G04_33045 [Actinoplanes sp. NPDC023801]|uniref:hypothetical protein n=1 Tax=Actinoplanes sp. NPDC023801 TaxID=3154595 RepID=UPI0033C37E12